MGLLLRRKKEKKELNKDRKGKKMKILHTSDLHLEEEKPETLNSLRIILEEAKKLKVDLVTLGGDTFDSGEDANILRSDLRKLFSGNEFDILMIPGNHDQNAFSKGLYFGEDVKVATQSPFECFIYGNEDICIVAVPYVEELSTDLFEALREKSEESQDSILLVHCTLDIGYSSTDLGEEGGTYFPVKLATLSKLNFDFVLAGHFHSNFQMRMLDNGGKFVYPGSPLSHNRKEVGNRYAAVVDTKKEEIQKLPLPTFYRDTLEKTVKPGRERSFIETAQDWIKKRAEDNCELKLIPRGHIKTDETTFKERLQSLKDDVKNANLEISHKYQSVKQVLTHPLYKRFKEKLMAREDVAKKEDVQAKVIEAMSRLIDTEEIRI